MTETRVVTPAALFAVWPCHVPTPLVDLLRLAMRCGVARVVLKDEGLRPLGSFKALAATCRSRGPGYRRGIGRDPAISESGTISD
jgi:hypothetical protein